MENQGDILKDIEIIDNSEKEKENEKPTDDLEENIEKNHGKEDENKDGKKEIEKKDEEKKKDKKEEKHKDKKEEKKDEDKKIKKKEKEFDLYFIQANRSNSLINIELEKNKYADGLNKVKLDLFDNELSGSYTINRLKIMSTSGMKDLTIKFKLLDTDNNNYKAEIKLNEFSHDYFLYDFKYELVKKKRNDIMQIDSNDIILNHYQQFKIYINYIEEILNKDNKDSLFKNLILSTKNLLIKSEKSKGKDESIKYYDFPLFFIVFTYCYETSIFLDLLKEFELKYINIKYRESYLSVIEITKIQDIFSKIEKNTENIFEKIEKEKDKDNAKYKANLFFIILIFKYYYDKENFQRTVYNIIKNEDTQKRIYRGIIRFPELFTGVKFEKKQISKMVSFCENFKNIKKALEYIVNINDYLEILLQNFDLIIEKREEYIKKEKNKKHDDFQLALNKDLVKDTDDIDKICENYDKIIEKQNEKKIDKFIIFGPKLFDKYINYNRGKNLGSLYMLKDLIKKIIKKLNRKTLLNEKNQNKKKDKNDKKDADDEMLQKYRESETKLDNNIYQTGLELSERGFLTNMEILDFIAKEKDYIKQRSKSNKEEAKSFAKIFKGLHINNINEEFLKEWKKFDWKDYFSGEEKYVYKYLFSSINTFPEFGILMKLLNISKNENEFKFVSDLIKKLNEKFIDIFEKNQNQNDEDYKKYIIELIYQSDSDNNIGSAQLLNYVQSKMNFEKTKNIYNDLCVEYGQKLTDIAKKIIILYFFQNSEDVDQKVLIQFAEHFEFLREIIFKLIEEYKLKDEDFWLLEDNNRIKLFKGLLEKADMNNNSYQKIEYIKESLKVIDDLRKKFDKNEVKYSDIILFFQNNKMDLFKKRILLIYLNNKNKANKKYDEILEKKK